MIAVGHVICHIHNVGGHPFSKAYSKTHEVIAEIISINHSKQNTSLNSQGTNTSFVKCKIWM